MVHLVRHVAVVVPVELQRGRPVQLAVPGAVRSPLAQEARLLVQDCDAVLGLVQHEHPLVPVEGYRHRLREGPISGIVGQLRDYVLVEIADGEAPRAEARGVVEDVVLPVGREGNVVGPDLAAAANGLDVL